MGAISNLPGKVSGSQALAVEFDPEPFVVSAPTAASVGVASAQVVAANALRRGLILVNTSANRISLGIGATAVLDSGITLMASGGSWSMGPEDFTTSAINAIASGAASNLSIQEFT